MSAFVVSDNHINAIVRWACRNNVQVRHNSIYIYQPGMEQEAASILLAENIRNVNYRYAHNASAQTDPATTIVYNPDAPNLHPLAVIKAVHCLDYQCSETDDYEQSQAAAILRAVLNSATLKLPGYDVAQWAI